MINIVSTKLTDFEYNYGFYIVYYTSLKGYKAGNFTAMGKTLGHFQIFVLLGVFPFLVELRGMGTIS